MPATMADFVPFQGNHAIEEATVAVRLWAPVADDAFRKALGTARQVAVDHRLPGRVQVPAMQVVFGRSQLPVGSPGVATANVFQRVEEDGTVAEELTLDPSSAAYRTRSYKRWADVQKLVTGAFVPILTDMTSGGDVGIATIELRCIDKFVLQPIPDAVDYRQLFRGDTPLLPLHVFEIDGLWHSHVGWFEDVTEDRRTLVNVNVDVLDQNSEDGDESRTVSINKFVSYQTNIQQGGLKFGDQLPREVCERFDRLHMRDKELLAWLLTKEAQRRIGLWGKEKLT
jgi:uncharacterized protein (TIGR04255 family)